MALTVLKLMRFTRKTTLHPQQSTYNLFIQLIGCHFELLSQKIENGSVFSPQKRRWPERFDRWCKKVPRALSRVFFCILLLEIIIRVWNGLSKQRKPMNENQCREWEQNILKNNRSPSYRYSNESRPKNMPTCKFWQTKRTSCPEWLLLSTRWACRDPPESMDLGHLGVRTSFPRLHFWVGRAKVDISSNKNWPWWIGYLCDRSPFPEVWKCCIV